MGLKNKANLNIKTMLTQKNEFILEASYFRFNCADLSLFTPISFSMVLCWKKKKKAQRCLDFDLSCMAEDPHASKQQTSQITLTSSAVRRT